MSAVASIVPCRSFRRASRAVLATVLFIFALVPMSSVAQQPPDLDSIRDAGAVRGFSVMLDPAARELHGAGWFRHDGAEAVDLSLSQGLRPDAVFDEGGNRLELGRANGRGHWQISGAAQAEWLQIGWRGELGSFRGAGRGGVGGRPLAGEDGAYLPGSSAWFPGLDGQSGASLIKVEVGAPYVAVVAGRLLAEEQGNSRYRARFVTEGAHRAPSLFAGPWEIQEKDHDGLTLRAYLEPDQRDLGREYMALSAQYIDEFAGVIGEYPFSAFAIVSAPIGVGLGYPGLTYVGRRVLPLPFFPVQSLAHEILHNWWGNGVLLADGGGNWSEGLTTYMADHTMANRHRENGGREMRRDWLRDYAALPEGRDFAIADFRSRRGDPSLIVGYSKSAYVFHMLRQKLGDDAFEDGLRRFWSNHRFAQADWPDLISAFERAAGRDLRQFFSQWLDNPGAPELDIADVGASPLDNGDYEVGFTLRQAEPAFSLDLPVDVVLESGERQRFEVQLTDPEQAFSLTASGRPQSVIIDPDSDVFRRLSRNEAPPILRDLTLQDEPLVTIAAGGDEDVEAMSGRLARRLFGGQGRIDNGETALLADEPFAVIGSTDAVAGLLEELGLDPQPPEMAGRGTASAWTMRTEGGNPVLAVSADNAEAMLPLVHSLPRQARQSWLVYSGRVAIGRGVWPAEDEPLSRDVPVQDQGG
nr:M1 family aminopeptidase [Methylonatrum kenyense]